MLYTDKNICNNPDLKFCIGDRFKSDNPNCSSLRTSFLKKHIGMQIQFLRASETAYRTGVVESNGSVRDVKEDVARYVDSIIEFTVIDQPPLGANVYKPTQGPGVKPVQESSLTENSPMKLYLISSYTTTKPDTKTGVVTSKQVAEPRIVQVENHVTAASLAKTEAVQLCRDDVDLDPESLTVEVRDLTSTTSARV